MTRGRTAPSGRLRLDVAVVHAPRLRASGLAAWLRRAAPAAARGVLTIALVPDAHIQALNRRYRKKNVATDVLSFAGRPEGRPLRGRSQSGVGADLQVGPNYLGDIVIATGVATRQAREAGHSVQTEIRILALHGLLHLLGYDHERDDGRMARLERRLREKAGLREGLIERGTSPPRVSKVT